MISEDPGTFQMPPCHQTPNHSMSLLPIDNHKCCLKALIFPSPFTHSLHANKHLTSFQGPVFHWAGQGILLQGRRLSGRSPRQYLLCTERLVPSWSGWRQRTVRSWYPELPQLLLQCSHSSATQLWEQEGAVKYTVSICKVRCLGASCPLNGCTLWGNNFLTMAPMLCV